MKLELLVCDFSFLGWMMLSAMTLSILDVWLAPYRVLTDLAYYEAGKSRLQCQAQGGAW